MLCKFKQKNLLVRRNLSLKNKVLTQLNDANSYLLSGIRVTLSRINKRRGFPAEAGQAVF